MSALMRSYRYWSKRRPLTVAFVTCFVKGGASDLFAQTIIEKRQITPWIKKTDDNQAEIVDFSRVLAFSTFSGGYLGCGQHFVYNVFFGRLFGMARTSVKMTLCDFLFVAPGLYLPAYYAFEYKVLKGSAIAGLNAFFVGDKPNNIPPEFCVVMQNYAKVWPGVMLLNFAFAPRELRIAVIASVSFVWLVILSTISHGKISSKESPTLQVSAFDQLEADER